MSTCLFWGLGKVETSTEILMSNPVKHLQFSTLIISSPVSVGMERKSLFPNLKTVLEELLLDHKQLQVQSLVEKS